MANERVLPGNVTIWAAYPEAFADLANPTVAEMNNTAMVFNISCAIEESYTLNQTGSETDDSKTICDVGDVSTPTFINYEASLDGFRDASLTDNGVFNLFYRLFKSKGVPFVLIKRLGEGNTEPAALTQNLSFFSVETDNPVDIVDDVTNIMLGARFKPLGGVNINHEMVA